MKHRPKATKQIVHTLAKAVATAERKEILELGWSMRRGQRGYEEAYERVTDRCFDIDKVVGEQGANALFAAAWKSWHQGRSKRVAKTLAVGGCGAVLAASAAPLPALLWGAGTVVAAVRAAQIRPDAYTVHDAHEGRWLTMFSNGTTRKFLHAKDVATFEASSITNTFIGPIARIGLVGLDPTGTQLAHGLAETFPGTIGELIDTINALQIGTTPAVSKTGNAHACATTTTHAH